MVVKWEVGDIDIVDVFKYGWVELCVIVVMLYSDISGVRSLFFFYMFFFVNIVRKNKRKGKRF